ncbi:MAG: TlpA disulfide reductase family protein [Bryobacteraceae bacterium]
MGAARQPEMLRAGHRAPEFSLTRLDGGSTTLREILAASPALFVFFKSTCPVCQMTLPYLERIHQGGVPGSLTVYGISQDDAATTREFVEEFGITFPMLLDTEESGYPASNEYSISHVPSQFLVEQDGSIGWSYDGFNRRDFQSIARLAGLNPFRPGEKVPDWKSG